MGYGSEAIRRLLHSEGVILRNRKEAQRQRMTDDDVTKRKIAKSQIRSWQNPGYREHQVTIRRGRPSRPGTPHREESKLKIANKAKIRFEDAELEKIVRIALSNLGLEYVAQKAICRAIADFYVPDQKKIIEADGLYWHRTQEQLRKDSRRDKWLEKQCYKIMQLSEETILDDPIPAIKSFLQIR